MAHRVLPALLLAPLLLCGRADAGDPPSPASPPAVRPAPPAGAAPPEAEQAPEQPGWHKQLAHRNARYASLNRVDDPAGDLHESIVAHMNLIRVGDPTGDMEEVRVARAAGKLPPRATAGALVARGRDAGGDTGEVKLAQGTHHRRFAETRRFRDIGGDKLELIAHNRDRQRRMKLQDENEIRVAVDRERPDALDSRSDKLDSDAERDEDARAERLDPFGRDPFDSGAREPMLERDTLDDPMATDLMEGMDVEGLIDDAVGEGEERLEEKLLENQTEAQAERAEGGGTGTSAP